MNCENCKLGMAEVDIDHIIFLCSACYQELYIDSGMYWKLQKQQNDEFKPITDFPELEGRTYKFNGELLIIRKEDGTQYLINKDGCNCTARIDLCRHFRFWKHLKNLEPPTVQNKLPEKDELERELFE